MRRNLPLSIGPVRAGAVRSIVKRVGGYAGELAVAAALLAAWLLVTVAIARMLRGDIVWPLSLGLLLFSAAGWRLFGAIALHGLYALSKEPE